MSRAGQGRGGEVATSTGVHCSDSNQRFIHIAAVIDDAVTTGSTQSMGGADCNRRLQELGKYGPMRFG